MRFSQYYNACRLANGVPAQMSHVLAFPASQRANLPFKCSNENKIKSQKNLNEQYNKASNSYNTDPKDNAVVLNNDELKGRTCCEIQVEVPW